MPSLIYMKNKIYNKINFHKHTFCVFSEMPIAEIQNRKVDYVSKSGSKYYFANEGVFRLSDHWGRAAKCKWRLDGAKGDKGNRERLGFSLWTGFHEDNDIEKLYFISVDFEAKTVTYQHKNNILYNEKQILRTVSDSTKLIKQIRSLFENDSWAKYFNTADVDSLRKSIIIKLIATNQSLQEIKSELLR